MHYDGDARSERERPPRDGLGRATTFAALCDEVKLPEAKLRARCEHLEAGLKVIADNTPGPTSRATSIDAVRAFAQSTLDEAPEAK